MLQLNSTSYIIKFAIAVCIGCSFFVATSAVLLSSRQETNRRLDIQRNVLEVAGLVEPGAPLNAAQAQQLFDERVETRLIDMESGEAVDEVPGIDVHIYDQLKASEDPAMSYAAAPNPAAVKRVQKYALIYEVYESPAKDDLDLRVLPVRGLGLWGTLFGFLALDEDNNTVRGLTFYQHKETPGLGGEVDNPLWKTKWLGRQIYDESGEPAIRVIKGPAGPPSEAPYVVDGLSGATITSNGVTNMLQFWLGEEGFGPYLATLRENGSTS